MLDHERPRLRPGQVLQADKGFAGQDFESWSPATAPGCCGRIAVSARGRTAVGERLLRGRDQLPSSLLAASSYGKNC